MKLTLSFVVLTIIMIGMVSAVVLNETEVRDAVCGEINLTETNCTNWWDNLNLTELDNEITNLNITVVQGGNYTTVYSSTIENKTYNYHNYNYTGNISDLNLSNTYTKSIIDNKISGLISTTNVDNKLTSYALKTDIVNTTTTTEIKDIEAVWKWAFGINIFITVMLIVGVAIILRQ